VTSPETIKLLLERDSRSIVWMLKDNLEHLFTVIQQSSEHQS